DLYVYDVASGKQVHEVIPRVHSGTAGGDVAWAPDGKGFFYTRYPRGKERPAEDMDFYQQLYFHELGTATEKDRYELGKELPRIAEIKVWTHDATGRLLCTVQNGDGGEFAHYVRDRDGKPATAPNQLPVSAAGDLSPMGGDDVLFANESYVQPLGQYLFRAKDEQTERTPLTSKAEVSFDDVKVVREFATSKDGTKVPV